MKVIIAGSRDINDYELLKKAVKDSGFDLTTIISGGARGVDSMGERYASECNIPLIRKPANWNLHGKKAGYLRNVEMAEEGEGLIVLYDGQSKGTAHMINIARERNLKIYLVLTNAPECEKTPSPSK